MSTPPLLETLGSGMNLHKREREFEVSKVVQMDDGSLAVKKLKVTLVSLSSCFLSLPAESVVVRPRRQP